MKFLLDENTSKNTASFLIKLGHEVFRIKKIHPGLEDIKVLELAVEQKAIVITLDKDYGELIFKEEKPHSGIIFLRLDNQTEDNVIKVLGWFLSYSNTNLQDKFVTVTEKSGKLHARFGKD